MEASETSTQRGFVTADRAPAPMVSIVIPAFNESARIGESIRKVEDFMRKAPFSTEFIVVDDGSSDNTSEIVQQCKAKNLRLIQNDRNHGKGYSVRQGVLAASGKYVLFSDADLSAPIDELTKLLDVATKERADVVIGSRGLDRSYIQRRQSRFRESGGIIFNWIVRLILGLQLHDTQCGFKLFNREKSRRIFEQQKTVGFAFDPEVLFLAKRNGLTIRETPVLWSHADGSKVTFLRDGSSMFCDLLRIRWNAIIGRYS